MICSVCVLKDSLTGAAGKPLTFFNSAEAIESYLVTVGDPDFPDELVDRFQFFETGLLHYEDDGICSMEYIAFPEPTLLCSGKEVVDCEKE